MPFKTGKDQIKRMGATFERERQSQESYRVITALPLFLETQQVREAWVNENTNVLQLTQSKHAKQDAVLSPTLLRINSILHGHPAFPATKQIPYSEAKLNT